MEKPDTVFLVQINPVSSTQNEITVLGRDIINQYEGYLAVFENPFEAKGYIVDNKLVAHP